MFSDNIVLPIKCYNSLILQRVCDNLKWEFNVCLNFLKIHSKCFLKPLTPTSNQDEGKWPTLWSVASWKSNIQYSTVFTTWAL